MATATGLAVAMPTPVQAPALQRAAALPTVQRTAEVPQAQMGVAADSVQSPQAVEAAERKRKGLDLSKMLKGKGQGEGSGRSREEDAQSADGGIVRNLLEAAGKTGKAVKSLVERALAKREGGTLAEAALEERRRMVEAARADRARTLREARIGREGPASRLRRNAEMSERAGTFGRGRAHAEQQRNRATADVARQRTVDGGVLRNERAPGRPVEGGVRRIADARRALPSPNAGNRTIEGTFARTGTPGREAPGRVVPGRQLRIAQGQAPSQLRLAAPRSVDVPSQAPRRPAMVPQRGAGIAAMASGVGR